jgi:hypothetical protein
MADAHKALYSILRDEFRRKVSQLRYQKAFDILGARKSVIRLLQASANPTLLVDAISQDRNVDNVPSLIQAVVSEGPSTKVQKAVEMAREFARTGRKVVLWTIFTDTLLRLNNMLADLRPVVLYGQVPTGSVDDDETREGRLEQFSKDPACFALVANPAAASEGFSIHRHCHDAIYVDRSYNATHYLQSIDRIHRLGLAADTVTNVWVLQNQVPLGIGSIDYSVSRRLAHKIREMQRLLEDPDLHELALDEETAPQPIEADVDIQDIDDLIKELEGRPADNEVEVV